MPNSTDPTDKPARPIRPVVIAKCVGCGREREIGPHEIPAGSHPMCDSCYMPLVAKRARGA